MFRTWISLGLADGFWTELTSLASVMKVVPCIYEIPASLSSIYWSRLAIVIGIGF